MACLLSKHQHWIWIIPNWSLFCFLGKNFVMIFFYYFYELFYNSYRFIIVTFKINIIYINNIDNNNQKRLNVSKKYYTSYNIVIIECKYECIYIWVKNCYKKKITCSYFILTIRLLCYTIMPSEFNCKYNTIQYTNTN